MDEFQTVRSGRARTVQLKPTGGRLGPRATVVLNCSGCHHHREDHVYNAQGEFAGIDHYCAGTSYEVEQCMGTSDRTPSWCPMMADVNERTNRATEGDGNHASE